MAMMSRPQRGGAGGSESRVAPGLLADEERSAPPATSEMTGLEKVRKACAVAAGWPWCDEHRSSRCVHPLAEGWQDYNPMTRDGED
jgi:hypothetical protein